MPRPARTSGAARLIIAESKPSKKVAVESSTNRKPWYGVTRADSRDVAPGALTSAAAQRRGCRGGALKLAGGRQPLSRISSFTCAMLSRSISKRNLPSPAYSKIETPGAS